MAKKTNAELFEAAAGSIGATDEHEREIYESVFPPEKLPPSEAEKKIYASLVVAIRQAMEGHGPDRGLQLVDAAVIEAQIRMRMPVNSKQGPHNKRLVALVLNEWQRYRSTHKQPKVTAFARELRKANPRLTIEAIKGLVKRHT
jgi:hypothetical protein